MELRRRRFLLSNDRRRMVNGTIQLSRLHLIDNAECTSGSESNTDSAITLPLGSRYVKCHSTVNTHSRSDLGSNKVRRQILLDFIDLHSTITEPELESEFAQSASLFFTRISPCSFSLSVETYSCLFSFVVTHQLSLWYLSERTTSSSARLPSIVDRQ